MMFCMSSLFQILSLFCSFFIELVCQQDVCLRKPKNFSCTQLYTAIALQVDLMYEVGIQLNPLSSLNHAKDCCCYVLFLVCSTTSWVDEFSDKPCNCYFYIIELSWQSRDLWFFIVFSVIVYVKSIILAIYSDSLLRIFMV